MADGTRHDESGDFRGVRQNELDPRLPIDIGDHFELVNDGLICRMGVDGRDFSSSKHREF